MTTINWSAFWNGYRKIPVTTDNDLFYQVGKTINGKPISLDLLSLCVRNTRITLDIKKDDLLLDLCCGNGLLTYELSAYAGKVIGIDFGEHLIEAAKKYKSSANIEYILGNIIEQLDVLDLKATSIKVLINDALAFFNNITIAVLLTKLCQLCQKNNTPLNLFITCIPDDELKWHFYDTPERKQRFLQNRHKGINDGMGKWWVKDELRALCESLNLSCEFSLTDKRLFNYRVNAHIQSNFSQAKR